MIKVVSLRKEEMCFMACEVTRVVTAILKKARTRSSVVQSAKEETTAMQGTELPVYGSHCYSLAKWPNPCSSVFLKVRNSTMRNYD